MIMILMSLFLTAEHILELQSIPRFLSSILDGQLVAVPSMGMNSVVFTQINKHVVHSFMNVFPHWQAIGSAWPAADQCLNFCGSNENTGGMVVAAGNLNTMKKNVRLPLSYLLYAQQCIGKLLSWLYRYFHSPYSPCQKQAYWSPWLFTSISNYGYATSFDCPKQRLTTSKSSLISNDQL
jgi:hypothetical protein